MWGGRGSNKSLHFAAEESQVKDQKDRQQIIFYNNGINLCGA